MGTLLTATTPSLARTATSAGAFWFAKALMAPVAFTSETALTPNCATTRSPGCGRKTIPAGPESSDASTDGVKFGSSDTTVPVRDCAGTRQPQNDPSRENCPPVTPGTPASCVANAEKSPARSAGVG